MLKYARSDTHFLLYIYDNLRNALLDRSGGKPDLIRMVLSRSEETTLRTYEREVYDFDTGLGPWGMEHPFPEMGTQIYGYEHGRVSIYPCMERSIARKRTKARDLCSRIIISSK